MLHKFTTKLPRRSAECTITESIDAIYVDISCSNYDGLQDDLDYQMWLLPILQRYDNDKRPIVLTSPNSDLIGVLEGTGDTCTGYLIDT